MASLLGCASDAADPTQPAGAPGEIDSNPPPPAEKTHGFSANPVVAFPSQIASGGGASDVAIGACRLAEPRIISTAEARDLGYDVDADTALLERERAISVLVSREQVVETTVHLLGRVDRVLRMDRTPPPGVALADAVPPNCPPHIGYELTVQLYTEDGSVSGAYTARTSATTPGNEPFIDLYGDADLRNFSGTLPLAVDPSRPFVSHVQISWYETQSEEQPFAFYFEPLVRYLDAASDCAEPCSWAPQSIRSSQGIATAPGVGAPVELEGGSPLQLTTLTDLVTTGPAYRPDVQLWAFAPSGQASSANVRVRIDGQELAPRTLTLQHDPQSSAADRVAGWIDLGVLDEAARVEAEVDAGGLAGVWSMFVIDGCFAAQTSNRCTDPGCTARGSISVSPWHCAPGVVY